MNARTNSRGSRELAAGGRGRMANDRAGPAGRAHCSSCAGAVETLTKTQQHPAPGRAAAPRLYLRVRGAA
jgi:hypothetical protein